MVAAMNDAIHIAGFASPIAQGDTPPERIMLLPASPAVLNDGRGPWTFADARALIAASQADGRPLVIDFDHATDTKAPTAPAAGWIESLEVEGGAIWGRVSWTPQGAAALKDKAYRFVSPVIATAPRSNEVKRLMRAGLVNDPAIPALPQLAASEDIVSDKTPPKTPAPAAVAPFPGNDAANAVAAGLGDDEALQKQLASALNTAKQDVDPAAFVPKAAFDEAMQRLKAVETASAEAAAAQTAARIDAAIEAGKLMPSMRDWAVGLAASNPDALAAYIDAAPTVAAAAAAPTVDGAPKTAVTLSDTEKQICAATGVSEEDFAKARKQEEQRDAA